MGEANDEPESCETGRESSSLQLDFARQEPVPQSVPADEILMLKVKAGNSQALQQLIDRYAQALLTFLTRLLGNRDDADDLLQESLVLLWARRATYDYPRPFRPWVFTIAANKGREWLRNKTRQLIRNVKDEEMDQALQKKSLHEPSTNSGPMEQILQHETNAEVLAATQRLPQQQRAVLSLRIWNDLSYAEIAEVLQVTESNVRSHMFHALKNLRLSLAKGGSHE